MNAEQASKKLMWEPTRQEDGEGRCRRFQGSESSRLRSHRGKGDGMSVQGNATQHGKPQRWEPASQPDAREGQAGPCGVADRLVVPWKPGNAGGGKGPDFGCAAEATKSPGIDRKV